VHKYKGAYYLFASFNSETRHRGIQILKSDSPMGPFVPISDGPVTPAEWECLDGTLYVEDGVPYIVFCHEWVQCKDGEMCALRLTDDLSDSVGEPMLLFKASSFKRVRTVKDRGEGEDGWYVTDGPFMYKTKGFHSTEKCISCGKCVKVCPLNNISLSEGKPVWSKNCTHCMACIGTCPTEAVEYGNITQTKEKYSIYKYNDFLKTLKDHE